MFQKLEQAGLKLKPSKCELFHKQITYLGHIISAQSVATDEEKISIIKSGPLPPLSLRFTGIHWVLLPVHPNFMQIAWPLHALVSGNNTGKKREAITWEDI